MLFRGLGEHGPRALRGGPGTTEHGRAFVQRPARTREAPVPELQGARGGGVTDGLRETASEGVQCGSPLDTALSCTPYERNPPLFGILQEVRRGYRSSSAISLMERLRSQRTITPRTASQP